MKIRLPLEFLIGIILSTFFGYILIRFTSLIGDVLGLTGFLISFGLILVSIDFKGEKNAN